MRTGNWFVAATDDNARVTLYGPFASQKAHNIAEELLETDNDFVDVDVVEPLDW